MRRRRARRDVLLADAYVLCGVALLALGVARVLTGADADPPDRSGAGLRGVDTAGDAPVEVSRRSPRCRRRTA